MTIEQSKKGGWCPYKEEELHCQEGYCDNCVIFRMSGKAQQVFKLFKLYVEYNGNKTLKEVKQVR